MHLAYLGGGGGEPGDDTLDTGDEFVGLGWDGGCVAFLVGFGFCGVFFSGTNATAAAHIQHRHDSHFAG